MIAVLLADDETFSRQMSHRLRLLGYDIIRFRDPVKLTDTITELAPKLLIVNGQDFPLHWQVLGAEISLLGMSEIALIIATSSFPRNIEQFKGMKVCWLEYAGSIDKNMIHACLEKLLPAKLPSGSASD